MSEIIINSHSAEKAKEEVRALIDERIPGTDAKFEIARNRVFNQACERIDFESPIQSRNCIPGVKDYCEKVYSRLTKMSPPGELGVCELLEKRRWEYFITDGAFASQPALDRMYVHQIDENPFGMVGSIYGSDGALQREHESNPIGIVVSAGLSAMDILRDHGIDVGHRITFVAMSPWRVKTDMIGGVDEHMVIMRVGDIQSSFDTMDAIRNGKLEMVYVDDEEKGKRGYFYKRSDGELIKPGKLPVMENVT